MKGVHLAAYFGLRDTMRALLRENCDLESKDFDRRTPLLWAARNGHEVVVKLLLTDERVDPDAKDSSERTPLSWAKDNGHEAVVILLLSNDRVDRLYQDGAGSKRERA